MAELSARKILEALKATGIQLIAGLSDSRFAELVRIVRQDFEFRPHD